MYLVSWNHVASIYNWAHLSRLLLNKKYNYIFITYLFEDILCILRLRLTYKDLAGNSFTLTVKC